MPFMVSLHCDGYTAVYDVANRTTKVCKVQQVIGNFTNFENVLQELCEHVKPTEVQRIVISHDFSYPPDLQSAKQKVLALGFTNVHFMYQMAIYVQAIVNEKFIRSVEDEHIFVTVRCGAEYTTLWRFSNNEMKFIQSLEIPSVVRVYNSDPACMVAVRKVIQTYGVRRWFVLNSPKTRDLIQRSNRAVHVVQWDQEMTRQQHALVTLWTAQRREGVVDGVLVENYHWWGPMVEVDGDIIYNKVSEGVAMPSKWLSNYTTVTNNITVNWDKAQWKFDFKTKENVQIRLCFDEDGVLDVKLTSPEIASILFKNDQMYLLASATDAVPDPSMIGPFSTRLRFEKKCGDVSENDSGENILSGILKMLDPSKPAEPGWKLVNNRFTANVCLPNGTDKDVDAQTAASHLLLFAINKVSRPDEWLDKLFIVVPEEFTDEQCKNLVTSASNIGISATIKRELDAVADGYAKKQNLQDRDRVVMVLPTIEGCKLKLFRVSGQKTELEAEKFEAKMNCEVLRQNQRNWEKRVHDSVNPIESGASEEEIFQLEHSSYSVAKGTEPWLEALRSMLQKLVCAANRDTVKRVVFVGVDARRLPLLNNLLSWTFLSAEVYTIVEEELKQLAIVTSCSRYSVNAKMTRLSNKETTRCKTRLKERHGWIDEYGSDAD